MFDFAGIIVVVVAVAVEEKRADVDNGACALGQGNNQLQYSAAVKCGGVFQGRRRRRPNIVGHIPARDPTAAAPIRRKKKRN